MNALEAPWSMTDSRSKKVKGQGHTHIESGSASYRNNFETTEPRFIEFGTRS